MQSLEDQYRLLQLELTAVKRDIGMCDKLVPQKRAVENELVNLQVEEREREKKER